MRTLLVVLLMLGIAPASAQAAKVSTSNHEEADAPGSLRPDVFVVHQVRFTAGPGERNNLVLRRLDKRHLQLTDTGAKLRAGRAAA